MAEDADRKMIQQRNIVLGAKKCESCLSRCGTYDRMCALSRRAKTARCAPARRLSLGEAGQPVKLRGPGKGVYGVPGITTQENQKPKEPTAQEVQPDFSRDQSKELTWVQTGAEVATVHESIWKMLSKP